VKATEFIRVSASMGPVRGWCRSPAAWWWSRRPVRWVWTWCCPAGLARWHKPSAVHDPAKIVLDVALALALGGDCLADVALLRAEPSVFGPVASDPTVPRMIDVLAADAPAALTAIDAAAEM
jgi:hypothetical protein